MENRTGKYFKYAIGEIILVVIGILIALQINNWNEERKNKTRLITNIHSIAKDISTDTIQLREIISVLQSQIEGGEVIIPVMESEKQIISDSLEFILAFNFMTGAPHVVKQPTTWDFLNSSGIISEFPDQKLMDLLQEYYSGYNSIVTNYTKTGIPGRVEIRRLKYELFTNAEHRKFFPTSSPIAPGEEVYTAIFEDKRVLPLCRFINSTATYFEPRFQIVQNKAEDILIYINKNYN